MLQPNLATTSISKVWPGISRRFATGHSANVMIGQPGAVMWYDRLAQAKSTGFRVRDGTAVALYEMSFEQCREGLQGLAHLKLDANGNPVSGETALA